jgi:chemotaxis protein methyltransferase CheR
MSPTPQELDAVCDLVHELCGIYLDDSKGYLIENRLADLVTRHGCENYVGLVARARAEAKDLVRTDIVNAITTNETLWFRDSAPFEALRFKLLPELIDQKSRTAFPKRIRIWSAACSTGQEPYSLAMALADIVPDITDWDVKVLGTDISPAAVAAATKGHYSQLEIGRGMDQSHLSGYFLKDDTGWQVCEPIRNVCTFQVRNLLEPFTALGQFDIIFCRNVAIYFTNDNRRKLFLRLADALTPTGWLLVGASESLSELGENWKPQQHCRAVCYQPNAPIPVLARAK